MNLVNQVEKPELFTELNAEEAASVNGGYYVCYWRSPRRYYYGCHRRYYRSYRSSYYYPRSYSYSYSRVYYSRSDWDW